MITVMCKRENITLFINLNVQTDSLYDFLSQVVSAADFALSSARSSSTDLNNDASMNALSQTSASSSSSLAAASSPSLAAASSAVSASADSSSSSASASVSGAKSSGDRRGGGAFTMNNTFVLDSKRNTVISPYSINDKDSEDELKRTPLKHLKLDNNNVFYFTRLLPDGTMEDFEVEDLSSPLKPGSSTSYPPSGSIKASSSMAGSAKASSATAAATTTTGSSLT